MCLVLHTLINSFIFTSLNRGDPLMFESFWEDQGDDANVVFTGTEGMSYFSTPSSRKCWFLEQKLHAAITALHQLVGNAETEGKEIVVGNGATQLFQALLYALSCDAPEPPTVVSAVPFYSVSLSLNLMKTYVSLANVSYSFSIDVSRK